MKVYQYSAKQLEKATRNKKIICFGAGKNCYYTLRMFKDMEFGKRIAYIVDNSPEKWGTEWKILNMECKIKGPEELQKENWSEAVVLMMIIKYEEPLKQLQRLKLNKMKVFIYPEYRFKYDKVLDWLSCHLPMKNYAVLQGEGDTCENAVRLVKVWKERGQGKYKVVWICQHPEKFQETKKEKYILRDLPLIPHTFWNSIHYYLLLNRAGYLIYENKMIKKVRKNQISCYMNHGIPLKSTKGFIQVFEDTDYVLSSSDRTDLIFIEQYGAKKEQLVRCGSPRTDVLFLQEEKKQLKDSLQLQKYSKMLLWTPTFRKHSAMDRRDSAKDFPFGLPLMMTAEDVGRLKKKLEEYNILLIIKPHIHQELSELVVEESRNIKVIKQDVLDKWKVNVYDLMKLADVMITDYSSIAFDYLLLNRPIGYTVDDMKDYKIGFSVPNPLDYMPGEHMETMEDMLQFIQDIAEGKDGYQEAREELKKTLFKYPDGKNGARLLDILGL